MIGRSGDSRSGARLPRLGSVLLAEPPDGPASDQTDPSDDPPSRLARAWQDGDRSVLPALYRAVQPLIGTALQRYGDRPGALPASLERGDLSQESWLILAELADRWQPTGSFGAYVRVTFPWALARYVRQQSPSRRARGVRVLGAELPDVQQQLAAQALDDGREWDADLAWSELLDHLTEAERAVLMLHLAEQQTFTAVAHALRLTRPAAYRLYRRALKRVQGSSVRVGERTVHLDADSLNLERRGDLVRLVQTLHRGRRKSGLLPGRHWLSAETGLSGHRVDWLLGLLVEAGCVVGRGARRAGRLADPSSEASLARLGIRPAEQP